MASDMICHHLWCHLVIVGRHIGRLWNLLHPIVASCLHTRVLVDLVLYCQKLLCLVSSLSLIAAFTSVEASIWRIFESHLLELLVQLVLIHYIFLFARPTSEFGSFVSPLYFKTVLVLLDHIILIRSWKRYGNIHVDRQRLIDIRRLMSRLSHWMICLAVVLVRIHRFVVIIENSSRSGLWFVTVIILLLSFFTTFLSILQLGNCFGVHFEFFIVKHVWI